MCTIISRNARAVWESASYVATKQLTPHTADAHACFNSGDRHGFTPIIWLVSSNRDRNDEMVE
jgi:hypothetical protein